MSTRRKGNTTLRECMNTFFPEPEYMVQKTEQVSRHAKQQDLFGFADALAISQQGNVYFIQTTTNRPHTHKDYVAIVNEWNIKPPVYLVQYVKLDRNGWMEFWYHKEGYETVDNRKKIPQKRRTIKKGG